MHERKHLTLTVTFVLTSFLTNCCCQSKEDVLTTVFANTGINDVIFTDDVIFEVRSRSKTECADVCRVQNCLTFTFLPRGDPATLKNCRGHTGVMTRWNANTAMPGARTYSVKVTNAAKLSAVAYHHRCPNPLQHCGDTVAMTTAGCDTSGNTSGIYKINVNGTVIDVYCDQDTDPGGWMVFLRRQDGSVNFKDKGWEAYKHGFGDLSGEHWLGLEVLNKITQAMGANNMAVNYELRVDMTRKSDLVSCHYINDHFQVWPEAVFKYQLLLQNSVADTCDGQNWLTKHTLMKFSTHDRDNDEDPSTEWAKQYGGGFWYSSTSRANPTGGYSNDNHPSSIFWGSPAYLWAKSCSFVEYKIRKTL